jgi:hypothetical protein
MWGSHMQCPVEQRFVWFLWSTYRVLRLKISFRYLCAGENWNFTKILHIFLIYFLNYVGLESSRKFKSPVFLRFQLNLLFSIVVELESYRIGEDKGIFGA